MDISNKTIAITGGTGFVGSHLVRLFKELGSKVIILTRVDLHHKDTLLKKICEADIIINLAGANIIHRWSDEYKKTLRDSRIDTTKALVNAINSCEKPKLLISTSAVGIYANDKEYCEENIKTSDDFLSKLCQEWEEEALKAKDNLRVVIFRFGIVLGADGGALEKMLTPFRLGLGGIIGSGKQAFSFIHIEDLVNAFKFAIENETLENAYNLTAPITTTNYGLTKALGKHLKRPTIFPVPEFVLKLIFSEGAKVLTDGQNAVPKRLLDSGFEFKYKNIDDVIKNLISK